MSFEKNRSLQARVRPSPIRIFRPLKFMESPLTCAQSRLLNRFREVKRCRRVNETETLSDFQLHDS